MNVLKQQNTLSKKLILPILLVCIVFLTSCEQSDKPYNQEATITMEQPIKAHYQTKHPYGGWSCPDNILGFPAVDIQEVENVPLLLGVPTKANERKGTSLMYFDTALVQNARPLGIPLPRLARYYSDYTKKNELVIIIQAIVADSDTVVGFRYLNGGNGTAWFGEVSFVSKEEVDNLKSTSFVSFNSELEASRAKIWEIITSPTYAKSLGKMFGKNTIIESDWKANSKVYLKNTSNTIISSGLITALWENMYIQIDYNIDGYHHVEKFLLLENKNSNSVQFHILAGPYDDDFETKNVAWENWLQKVKELSEVD